MNEELYKITNHIRLIRRVIDLGYESALSYSFGEEEEKFIKSLENKTKEELLDESKKLKNVLNKKPNRTTDKFCIRKCKKEFIKKDNFVEVYCSSCDRTIGKKPIKK